VWAFLILILHRHLHIHTGWLRIDSGGGWLGGWKEGEEEKGEG